MVELPTTGRTAPRLSLTTVTTRVPSGVVPAGPAVPGKAASIPAILGVVILGNFLGPLYSSTANVVLPNLEASFATDVETMEWAVTGYMLGFSIAMPAAAWLGDRFGRRRIYLIGIAAFVVFSILVSLAWDASSLIAFRVLQAVAGGLVSPTGLAIVNDAVPPAQRGRALGLWGMGMMLAPAFGPWISGAIVDTYDDWRPIFMLGVPIGLAALAVAARVLPADDTRRTVRTRFDTVGFGLLTTSLVALLVPLSQGTRIGWDDLAIQASFVLAAVTFVGFVVYELRVDAPLLDLRLFKQSAFALPVILRAVLAVGYYVAIYLLPLFTQTLLGWTPTLSGFALVPGGIIMALLMPVAGSLADRFGTRPLAVTGLALLAVGTFGFAKIDFGWDVTRVALENVVRSVGLACLFTPLTSAALGSVPRAKAGAASGIVNTVWQVCGSIGISLAQAYLDVREWTRYSDAAGSVVQSRSAVQNAMWDDAAIVRHAGPLARGAVAAMLHLRVENAADVRAYGDTFAVGALVVALALPVAFALRGRKAIAPARVEHLAS
jgi:EmrB/QacA subfamily drug resistance transporter